MFAACQLGGTCFAFPDVCKTPAPPAPAPIPIPYPNVALGPTAVSFVPTVLVMGGPAHNMGTSIPLSNGDQPGVAGGMVSSVIMGECKFLTGAFTILCHGKPFVRLTSATLQNKGNIPGMYIAPAQVCVLLLAP